MEYISKKVAAYGQFVLFFICSSHLMSYGNGKVKKGAKKLPRFMLSLLDEKPSYRALSCSLSVSILLLFISKKNAKVAYIEATEGELPK